MRSPLLRAALLSLLVAIASTAAPASAAGTEPDSRPNVLHILTDDQTIDSLRYMQELQRTLIDRGTRFSDYHTVQPLCCPSRATFLTGQYPHNHRILSNLEPFGYGAMDWSSTLYTSMHDAGYRTGWLGKVMNAKGEEGLRPEPGFDEWLVPIGEGESGSMFNYALSDNGRRRFFEDRFQNDVLAERAHEFVAAGRAEKPWFLTVSFHSPHWTRCPKTHERCAPQPAPEDAGTMGDIDFPFPPNYNPSPQYRFRTNRYWDHELESLQSVDRVVGSLVAQLNRQGELNDTVIIFQSDNGFLHGEHAIFDKNVPWDRSIRVPLIIRGPGFGEGVVRSDLTANVDVPATILDLAGAKPPRPPDGYSLLGGHRRRFLLLERLVTTNDRKRYPWLEVKTAKGLTYWRDLRGGHVHLYDLRSDQWQARNLAAKKPGLVRTLERRVRRARHCADPCP